MHIDLYCIWSIYLSVEYDIPELVILIRIFMIEGCCKKSKLLNQGFLMDKLKSSL